ncbi:InlB B-repeat-containing protein [Leifsonia sp. Le1]|uniref:InlB B-repeat-containing protein n=1 Tax=Leifsonia sp. Le1 TaxID=3404918 RepID=UPI003EBA59CE
MRRPGAAAAALVAGLLLGLLAPALVAPAATAAIAAAPAGSATVPGIWNVHTVTFRSLGHPLASIQVVDGGHAPRQPAPPAADGVFDGWVTGAGGSEVPFDFLTTVVTSDLVVDARFTNTHTVQFLAGPSAADTRHVIDADEVADGAPLGDIAPDVSHVPDGQVFTGDWYRQGDASRTPYDFSSPVTANLRLVPVFAAGFAVSFVTDGTAVEPEFVLEPDTEFTAADLAAVPPPTRPGYAFTQWWADVGRTQPIAFPITDTATLYAGWSGQSVDYHVSYWLEKANVVPAGYPAPVFTPAGGALPSWGASDGALTPAQLGDPGTYDFLDDIAATATAGTTVSGPAAKGDIPASIQSLVRAQLDPANAQADPMTFADLAVSQQNVAVQGDGSTVVNVYLTRALWRADFTLISPGSSLSVSAPCAPSTLYDITMTVGGTTYYQSTQRGGGQLLGTFSVREKIGFDMKAADVAPVSLSQVDGSGLITALDSGTQNQSCVMRGWGPQQVTPDVFNATYTAAYADAGSVNLANRTTSLQGKMAASRTQNLTQRYVYTETVDQSITAPDAVIGPGGTPNDPLHLSTLYNNDKTTVRVDIPTGHRVFSPFRTAWYWATTGDRQVASPIEGFTSYVGYGTGAATIGNYFQLDAPTNRLYQLKNSANTNDKYRYQFYSRNAYTLSFVSGGGTAIPPVPNIPYESSLGQLAPADPTRGNDVFQGWFTDSEFNVPFRFDGATMPPSNLVLYAKWLNDPHTVQFYDHPSTVDPIDGITQIVEDQGTATEPAPLPPQPDGQTFVGWFQRTTDGFFVPYDFDTPVGGDLRIYARWQQPAAAPFPMLYDGDGNTWGAVPSDPNRYDAGSSAIVADGSSLRRGNEVFIGWRPAAGFAVARIITSPVPGDGLYQAGRTVRFGAGSVTLTAAYANPDPRFTVTFRENAGSARSTAWDGPPGASITYPDAADLSFTGPGSDFLGWATSPTATTPDPAYDRLVVSTLTADLTLYAVWAAAPGPTPTPSPPPAPPITPAGDLPDTGSDPTGGLLLATALFAAGIVASLIRHRRHPDSSR